MAGKKREIDYMGIRLTLSGTIFSGLQKFLFSLANIFSLNMRDIHSLLNQAIEQQSSRTGGSTNEPPRLERRGINMES